MFLTTLFLNEYIVIKTEQSLFCSFAVKPNVSLIFKIIVKKMQIVIIAIKKITKGITSWLFLTCFTILNHLSSSTCTSSTSS